LRLNVKPTLSKPHLSSANLTNLSIVLIPQWKEMTMGFERLGRIQNPRFQSLLLALLQIRREGAEVRRPSWTDFVAKYLSTLRKDKMITIRETNTKRLNDANLLWRAYK
jgi:hypothetical protein